MSRVAAVDCGTNSIRLLVADVDTHGGGALTDVVRRMEITRLGQGVDRTGRLAPEAIERTRQVLAAYTVELRQLGARRVRVVATSATRDAANQGDFEDMVRATSGTTPEVITGEEEAALSFAGAVRGLGGPAAEPPYLVVDIGGGSTEVVLGDGQPDGSDAPGGEAGPGGTVEAVHSMDIGCVRLTERHFTGPDSDPPSAERVAAAEADIRAALEVARRTVSLEKARTVVGLAGSVTTVAALALGLPRYDATRIHHSRIGAAQIREVSDRLLTLSHAERAALPVLHPGRVDVIGAGALVLRVITEDVGADQIIVSEHDILDGIAWSLA
ncbi:MAG TPA: Ppx/GppA phosphatase family protein [Mycobacteriales bacterium]|nr:Ppx/GppA phosphatase family protein [Mycobacteriales bacterium]